MKPVRILVSWSITLLVLMYLLTGCGKSEQAASSSDKQTPAASGETKSSAATSGEVQKMGAEIGHFHPKGKPPSEYTLKILEAAKSSLPFSDTRDFDEDKKGFIAAPEFWQIKNNRGAVVWDMERYKFFLEGKDFPSIHPSLQRQSTLNMNYGLYEVMPGVYQVRGFDLANISFVKGDTGWIIFDPLTA